MRKTWVWSLGWDDLLKKGKATYSSVLAWRIPWTIQSMGLQSQARLSNFYFHCLNSCHGSKWQMIEEKVNGQIWSPSPWIFSFLISSILLISSSFITLWSKNRSVVSHSLRPHRLYRPEYWSGQPFPSPGDLPNPGIEPRSLALREDSLPAGPQGNPITLWAQIYLYLLNPEVVSR